MLKIEAYAKINLYLDILDKREDGYHNLNMVMQSVSLRDTLVFENSDSILITSKGFSLPEKEQNQAYIAAKTFFETTGIRGGLHINIQKRIPIMSGLGGASADGAATLKALNILYNKPFTDEELSALAAKIGSDTPFSLTGGTMHAKGRGEILSPIQNNLNCWYLIMKPRIGVSTKTAFTIYDIVNKTKSPPIESCIKAIETGDLPAFAKSIYNALTPAAASICPQIKDTLAFLEKTSLSCFMSGSGSACVGIYASREAALEASQLKDKPLGFSYVTQAVPQGNVIIEDTMKP